MKRGRPAGAAPEAVLALARARYLAGERLEVKQLAAQLGLGRATIYRWFHSRERLLGEVIAQALEELFERTRAEVGPQGARGLLEVFDQINGRLARSTALRRLLEQERERALRLLTGSGGPVQPRAVAAVQRLINAEIQAGRYRAPVDPATLAYALVRLAEAFLYNDAAAGIRGEHRRLHELNATLLGVPAGAEPYRAAPTAQLNLVLRPLRIGDEDELLRIHRRPEIVRWWDEPAAGFPWDEPESTRLTIEVDGVIAGLIQFWEEPEPKYRHAGIDMFLDPSLHGQGIGSEAVRRVTHHLLEQRGHHRITIDPASANIAAIRAYAKAGFTPVGVMRRSERDAEGGGWHDSLLMELVAGPTGETAPQERAKSRRTCL